jgi:glycosyltransferase 2 family protein
MKRRWILWLLAILFVWVVVSRFSEIQTLAETLAQGQWEWVVLAGLLQAISYLAFAAMFLGGMGAASISYRFRDMLAVTLASVFVNTVAPIGGASGVVLFVDDAAQRGQSSARASAGVILALLAEYGTFAIIVLSALAYLHLQHRLKPYQVAGAAALWIVVAALSLGLVLALWRPDRLRRVLDGIRQGTNRATTWLRRPALLPEEWAARNAAEFVQAASALRTRRRAVASAWAAALTMHLVSLVSVACLFLAFYKPVELGTLVAGFAIGNLFRLVAFTPQGIGLVEGAMTQVYVSLGVPDATATVISLAFRGLSFWLPLLVGFVLVRSVRSFRQERDPRKATQDGAGAAPA